MHNNKEFHVLEREEYRQLKGTEVDLMRVTCKLQTFWYSGSSFRPLFRCNRTKTLRQIDSKAIQKKKSKTLCTRRGASCARRTLESYNAGVGREGLIWVWIVCGVGDLYLKRYTNVRDIIMRFEKGCKGNLFCLITTFAVFTDSYVS